jgi:hypothetical protein
MDTATRLESADYYASIIPILSNNRHENLSQPRCDLHNPMSKSAVVFDLLVTNVETRYLAIPTSRPPHLIVPFI